MRSGGMTILWVATITVAGALLALGCTSRLARAEDPVPQDAVPREEPFAARPAPLVTPRPPAGRWDGVRSFMDRMRDRFRPEPGQVLLRIPELKKRCDHNENGLIEPNEWEDALKSFDLDSDRWLSETELVLAALSSDPSIAPLADDDHNGIVTHGELKAFLAKVDRNKDGKATRNEGLDLKARAMLSKNPWVLEHFKQPVPGSLPPALMDELVRAADQDKNGLLTPEEAQAHLMSIIPHAQRWKQKFLGPRGGKPSKKAGGPPDFLSTYDY